MAQIKYSKPQREFIEATKQGIAKAKELKASEGYVVAGFGGDTYYCYVGDGKGFQGSCFFPMTVSAIVFDTEKEGCCLLDAAVMLRYNHDAFYM